MSEPFLIAETPRAGQLGHRVLVPPGRHIAAHVAADLLQAAAHCPDGRDYLAVQRHVQQRLSNGAIRQGLETILLVGICVDGLSEEQKWQLRSMLQRRLADLEMLIQTVDWDAPGHGSIVAKQEMIEWLKPIQDMHLPHIGPTLNGFGPRPPISRYIMLWGTAVTVLVATSLWLNLPAKLRSAFSPGTRPTPAVPSEQTQMKQLQDQVRSLATRLDVDPEVLIKALYWSAHRSANGGRAPSDASAADVWSRIGGDPRVRENIAEDVRQSHVDYYAFIDLQYREDLIAFLGAQDREADARKARSVLAILSDELLRLREEVRQTESCKWEAATRFVLLLEPIRAISDEDAYRMRTHSSPSTQPFFDDADWVITDKCRTIFRTLAGDFAVPLTPKNPAPILDAITRNAQEIEQATGIMLDYAPAGGETDSLKALRKFYRAIAKNWGKYTGIDGHKDSSSISP